MSKRLLKSLLFLSYVVSAGTVRAQDLTLLGGALTSDLPPTAALQLPAPNVADDRRQFHIDGHGDFHTSFEFTKIDNKPVLGPNFNHVSCGGCHVEDGRGPIRFAKSPPGSAMLIKVSVKGRKKNGAPKDVPGVGEQLQDHTLQGKSRFNIKLSYSKVRGQYPDGTRYTLRRPIVSFSIPGFDSRKILSSVRMTPPTIGMGLLEAIPNETLIAMSDPGDLDKDGISGRVSYVADLETGTKTVGRFGFRATHVNIRQQSAAAFFNDMGMTSEILKKSGQPIEVSPEVLARVQFYLQAAGVTPARDQSDPDVIAGKALFQQVNCSGCHKMTLQTGPGLTLEVANQEIHPFTDLLLHDMGPDLADNRPEFTATGREWRTTPLWGLGLFDVLSRSAPGFLHDGRARNFEEAILWHGGEAKKSREAFKALTKTERAQLIRFLRSL